jgi:hypothetical protein
LFHIASPDVITKGNNSGPPPKGSAQHPERLSKPIVYGKSAQMKVVLDAMLLFPEPKG